MVCVLSTFFSVGHYMQTWRDFGSYSSGYKKYVSLLTNTSANADGPRDAALRKIDHIAQRASVDSKQIATQTDIDY